MLLTAEHSYNMLQHHLLMWLMLAFKISWEFTDWFTINRYYLAHLSMKLTLKIGFAVNSQLTKINLAMILILTLSVTQFQLDTAVYILALVCWYALNCCVYFHVFLCCLHVWMSLCWMLGLYCMSGILVQYTDIPYCWLKKQTSVHARYW